MTEKIKKITKKIFPILRRYHVIRAGIFGSVARGEAKKNSDIDILVDIKKNIGLFDFIGLKLELEDMLGRAVDLVEYDTIKPILKERILKEEVVIL